MTDLETRARDAIAQQERERLDRTIEKIAAEDERAQREQTRKDTLAALARRLDALSTQRIDKARQKLRVALELYADTVDAFNGEIGAVREELEEAGLQQEPAVDAYHAGSAPGITINGVQVRPQPRLASIVALIEDLHRRRYPRQQLDFSRPAE